MHGLKVLRHVVDTACMSGGVGLAQFRTCSCGGLLNETWDACRFCGEAAAVHEEPDSDETDVPDGSPKLKSNDDAPVPGTSRSVPLLPVLAVALVIAVLGFFVFQRPSDGAASDRAAAEAQRAAVAADFGNWCAGDRAIGIAEAPTFDASQRDRAVFVAPVPGDDAVHDMSRLDDPKGYASVIVCQDVIGEPVAGAPCEGAGEPRPMAFFHLVAYASRSAEPLGEMDAGPNPDCGPPVGSGAPDAPARLVATPDPADTSYFVTLFGNPT